MVEPTQCHIIRTHAHVMNYIDMYLFNHRNCLSLYNAIQNNECTPEPQPAGNWVRVSCSPQGKLAQCGPLVEYSLEEEGRREGSEEGERREERREGRKRWRMQRRKRWGRV